LTRGCGSSKERDADPSAQFRQLLRRLWRSGDRRSDTLDLFSLDSECNLEDLQTEDFKVPLNSGWRLCLRQMARITFTIDGEVSLGHGRNARFGFPAFTSSPTPRSTWIADSGGGAGRTGAGDVVENYDAGDAVVEELFTLGVIPRRGGCCSRKITPGSRERNWFTPLAPLARPTSSWRAN
jgi:hypothetical protein